MKLQIAMDTLPPQELLEFFGKVKDFVDIVELGTPYMLRYGVGVIEELRMISPTVEILCDAKIMDAGFYEAEELFAAGADYVTVLAVTELSTLADAVKAAKKYRRKTVADMICVADIPAKVQELDEIGIDVIAVHTGVDQQAKGRTPLSDLKEMKQVGCSAEIAVAGGISSTTLAEYMELRPEIIIVGGAILKAEDPVDEARKLYEAIETYR